MLCVQADSSNTTFSATALPVILHKYDEIINGREYHIEVSNVGAGQWRAHIKRTPGGSAALMPFLTGGSSDRGSMYVMMTSRRRTAVALW